MFRRNIVILPTSIQPQHPHLEGHLCLGGSISLSLHHLPPLATTLSPHSKAVFVGGNESLPRYCPVPLQQPSPHHILTRKLSPMDDNTPQQRHRSSPINDNGSPPAPHNDLPPAPRNSSPINNNSLPPLPPPPPHMSPVDGIVLVNGIILINSIILPAHHNAHATGHPPIDNNALPPPPHTFSMDGIVSVSGIVLIGSIISPVYHNMRATGMSYHHTTTCTPTSPLQLANSTSLLCPYPCVP